MITSIEIFLHQNREGIIPLVLKIKVFTRLLLKLKIKQSQRTMTCH
jgi:hypothetical protein